MQKNFKKAVSALLAAVMLAGIMCIAPFTASAEASGDYEYKILDDGTTEITKYNGNAANVTIPAKLNGVNVTSIGKSSFSSNTSIKSVTFPEGIISIGYSAFSECSNLSDISIPKSLEHIGNAAFDNTKWYINQPDGVVYLDRFAYDYKGNTFSVTSIEIKSGTKTIIDWAFSSCLNLRTVSIPDSLEVIDSFAFSGCAALESITIPKGVKYINSGAFDRCSSLKSVTIKEGLEFIDSSAFKRCTSLENITIPNSVTKISYEAFYNCTSLKNVVIGSGLNQIGDNPFADCINLESFSVNKNNTALCAIDGVLFNKDATSLLAYPNKKGTAYAVPSSVKKIYSDAFYGCDNLEKVTLPNGLTSIYGSSFEDCPKLKSITVPQSVKYIGYASLGYMYEDYTHKKRDDFVIYGYDGTGAENYATTYGIKFVNLGQPTSGVPGDLDGDNEVSTRDVLMYQKHLAKILLLTDELKKLADINGDGQYNSQDVLLIQKIIAKIAIK